MRDETEKTIIRELQGDIPITERPFETIALKIGIPEAELIEIAKGFKRDGIIRRFGATLRHRQAGFSANGMVVWIVPEEEREKVGTIMAAFPEVTHCYERPCFEDWPYNLFTMVHGQSRDECFEIAERISKATGMTEFKLIFSSREFKKTSMRYY